MIGLADQNACIFDGPQYRYVLRKKLPWEKATKGTVVWIMLNPSTADTSKLDPTLTRCWKWTFAWGYTEMVILNLFAFRSPSPAIMRAAADPVGEHNDAHILREMAGAQLHIVAWGAGGNFMERDKSFLRTFGSFEFYCLGKTKDGFPTHPLARGKHRVPDNIQLIRFNARS